jgi:hypothetical protein
MKKIYVVIFLLLSTSAFAQSNWEKLFSLESTDVFRCVREVPSGGYILAGYTSDSTVNDTDAFVVKLNSSGDTAWTFRYNGPQSHKDVLYKIIPTADGGYIACGYTNSITGISDDILYIKLSGSGSLQWVKTLGGSGRDRAQDIIQTSDGKYTIAGYTMSPPAQYYDAYLIRLNSSGDTLWTKMFGSSNYDDANAVRELSGGGYILAGQSENGSNGFDQYLIETDASGNLSWQKKIGTTGTDNVDGLVILSDGFLLAGGTNGAGAGGDDGYLVKTDFSGNQIWFKTFGGSQPDDFHRVEVTSDGGFIISGTTESSGNSLPNAWLVKTDASGNSSWEKTFGGDNHDHGYSAQQTSDGGYIIAGHSGSFGFNNEDAYVVKTDGSGNITNHLTYTTVFAILEPSTCGSDPATIEVTIRNFGNQSVPNVPVTVNITGGTTNTSNGTYNSQLNPQDVTNFTIYSTADMSAGGNFTLNCFTNNSNDVYPAHNGMVKSVSLSPGPSLSLGTDTNVFPQTSFTINAGPGFSSYSWSNGATGQSINVSASDTFCVTVSSGGCTATDCIFVDFTDGIEEIRQQIAGSVFPNPADGYAYIEFANSYPDIIITVSDLTGRIIYSHQNKFVAAGEKILLDLKSFSEGLYTIRINSGNMVDVRKLLLR